MLGDKEALISCAADASSMGSEAQTETGRATSGHGVPRHGGIYRKRGQRSKIFEVKVTWQNFMVVSQVTDKLEEAIELHILVVRARTDALAAQKAGRSFGEAVQEAFAGVLQGLGEPASCDLEAQLRFASLVFHGGFRFKTPFVRNLSMALAHRHRFEELAAADVSTEAMLSAKSEMIEQKRAAAGGRMRDHGRRNRAQTKRRRNPRPGQEHQRRIRARWRLLRQFFEGELSRRRHLHKQLGARSGWLPSGVNSVLDGSDGAWAFAQLEAPGEGAGAICGPCRGDLGSASADLRRLRAVLERPGGGAAAARAEAERLDMEVAMRRFREML